MESAQGCHSARLYVYDLSRGLARRLSPVMLGNLHFMALYGGLYLYCMGGHRSLLVSYDFVGPMLPIVTDI